LDFCYTIFTNLGKTAYMDFITLQNKDQSTLIKDVLMHPLTIHKDESGVLVETMKVNWKEIYGPDRDFQMQYYSITPPGLARDEDVWHYHPGGQEDRFLVIKGEIITAIADNREDSPTKGLLNLFYMKSDEDPYIVLIPKRTLHGFMVVSKEPGILLNFPTRLYDPKEEMRIPYDEADIKYPDGKRFSWTDVRNAFPHLS
jgi:dTDP-4-dehydrorhamnose 3,5-epimerase